MYVVYESKGGKKQERQALLDIPPKKGMLKEKKKAKRQKASGWNVLSGLWKVGSDQKAVSPGAESAEAPRLCVGPLSWNTVKLSPQPEASRKEHSPAGQTLAELVYQHRALNTYNYSYLYQGFPTFCISCT